MENELRKTTIIGKLLFILTFSRLPLCKYNTMIIYYCNNLVQYKKLILVINIPGMFLNIDQDFEAGSWLSLYINYKSKWKRK